MDGGEENRARDLVRHGSHQGVQLLVDSAGWRDDRWGCCGCTEKKKARKEDDKEICGPSAAESQWRGSGAHRSLSRERGIAEAVVEVGDGQSELRRGSRGRGKQTSCCLLKMAANDNKPMAATASFC